MSGRRRRGPGRGRFSAQLKVEHQLRNWQRTQARALTPLPEGAIPTSGKARRRAKALRNAGDPADSE